VLTDFDPTKTHRMPKFEHSVTTVRDDESEPIILEFYANYGSRISVSALKSPPAPDDTGNDEAGRTPDDATQDTGGNQEAAGTTPPPPADTDPEQRWMTTTLLECGELDVGVMPPIPAGLLLLFFNEWTCDIMSA
jgi:hypothetical protein